jgi:hypothetical protein
MTASTESKTRELVWRYPDQEGQPFLLTYQGSEVGWLQFREAPAVSTGGYGGTRLIFRYTAAMHPRVTVASEEDPQHIVAEFLPCWTGGGWVSFDSGGRYRWRKAHIWGGGWCFTRFDQESSVCLSQEAAPLMRGGKVSVCGAAADLPETQVLLLLAWFLRIMDFEMLVEGLFRVG